VKRAVLFFLYAVLFITAGFAQEYTISKINFLPQEYYVGDFVELRFIVRTATPEKIHIPETFPTEDWLEFDEIQVLNHSDGAEIHIVFRSFYAGTRTLPAVNFDSFILDKVKIETKSILSQTSPGFSEPRGQLYLPGTKIIIIILVFIFLIIPLFALFLAGRLRKWIRKIIAQQKEKKPIKKFYRRLDELKKQAGRISSRDFYIILTNALRKYLSVRSGRDYQAVTTREIDKRIEMDFPGIQHLHDLVEVLRYGDEIKFSPRRSSYYKEIRDIEFILRVINAIEDSRSGKRVRDEVSVMQEKEVVE
jgi:hypothetical protein